MALNVVMIGPPGAGKGTQAQRLCRQHGIPKIATGEILREAVQAGTPLGLQVKDAINAGKLASDETMIAIVRERLAQPDATDGFVLDGFPRTVPQAVALDGLMAGRGPLIVLVMVVPEDELVRRMRWRRVCRDCGASHGGLDVPELAGHQGGEGPVESGRCRSCGGPLVVRADDSEAVIRHRLHVYAEQTAPLVDYYQDRPTFARIDGVQSPDQVSADLNAAIEAAAAVAQKGAGRARA